MLEVRNLRKSYGDLLVLNGISLTVCPNEIVGLVGPSGCGKTTALNIVSGHDGDYTGTVENTFKRISCVFQEDRLLPWCSVYENISVVNDDISASEVQHLLETMELADFAHSYPSELSGGMRQRVSIARAFAYNGSLLLMDEPFKSLDQKLKESILRSFVKLFRETDLSVLMVTHDHAEAALLCDRIVLLTERPSEVICVLDNTGDKLRLLDDQEHILLKVNEIREKLKG